MTLQPGYYANMFEVRLKEQEASLVVCERTNIKTLDIYELKSNRLRRMFLYMRPLVVTLSTAMVRTKIGCVQKVLQTKW